MSDPKTIGIIGLGLLGRGIAACLLAHGLRVVACDRDPAARITARQHVADAIADLVQRGDFPRGLLGEWRDRLEETEEVAGLGECDFIIESVFENLEAKQTIFDAAEAVVGPQVPIASNTSALPISVLQEGRRHPQRFVGMHWAEPCHLTRFLEVIRGAQTDDATVDAALALGHLAGKEPSLVRQDIEGFIANRLGYAMYREAFHLLESGVADVETIDRSFRLSVGVWANIAGPFRWMDLTGIQAYAAVMQRLFPLLNASTQVPETMQKLVESGAQGIRNGRGFYSYTADQARAWERRLVDNAWLLRSSAPDHDASVSEVKP